MAVLLLLLYAGTLTGMGFVWYRLLVEPHGRPWTALAWSFSLGTILWAGMQFFLNVFNLPMHGAWIFFWQALGTIVPLAKSKRPVLLGNGNRHSGASPAVRLFFMLLIA